MENSQNLQWMPPFNNNVNNNQFMFNQFNNYQFNNYPIFDDVHQPNPTIPYVFENPVPPSIPPFDYRLVPTDHNNNNNVAPYPLERHSGDEIRQISWSGMDFGPNPQNFVPDMMRLQGAEPEPVPMANDSAYGEAKMSKKEKKKKDARRWSPEEHKLLLIGIKRYNKGDWRSISRYMVTTRSPTQVASHAQKYFNRQKLQLPESNKKKRLSIHDMKLDEVNDDDTEVERLHIVINEQVRQHRERQNAKI